MATKFRLTPGLFREMQRILVHDAVVEQGCFLLCSEAKAKFDQLLIANRLIILKNDDFTVQKADQLSFSPAAMLKAVRAAQENNSGLCFVHTHPMSVGEVDFSLADDIGNTRTFAFFNRTLPDNLNSALVFSGDMKAVSGRIYHTAHDWTPIDAVNVVGCPTLLKTTGSNKQQEVS